jgi:membrane protease YdiL (CAAX protease family)
MCRSSSHDGTLTRIEGPAAWCRLVLGLVLVFALFHGTATILGSDRGQSGILIGVVVVLATALADRFLLRRPFEGEIRALGLGLPRLRGMAVASGIASLLLTVGFLFVQRQGVRLTLFPGALALMPGLFMQAGVAEEVLFRAYLFGHIRVGRTFWRAAALSMLPFAGVHLVMFWSMPWVVALAALLLAIVISFPLAYLFELGGNTIWAPALLHFVIQATVKVIVLSHGAESFALLWMVASAVVPLLFLRQPLPFRAPRGMASRTRGSPSS